MSRAQAIRMVFQIGGLGVCAILFVYLPFGPLVDFLIGAAVWLVIGGIGERYFSRHATPEEIRTDLEERKDSPG